MSEEDKDKVEDGSIEITLEDDGDEGVEVAVEAKQEPEQKPARDKQDADLEDQSEKVRKRIDKLTFKIRESERREQAALDFARGLKGELDSYKKKASILDQTLVQEFDTRIKSQERFAKDKLKQAIDMGDADAQIEAQSQLANVAVENERLRDLDFVVSRKRPTSVNGWRFLNTKPLSRNYALIQKPRTGPKRMSGLVQIGP